MPRLVNLALGALASTDALGVRLDHSNFMMAVEAKKVNHIETLEMRSIFTRGTCWLPQCAPTKREKWCTAGHDQPSGDICQRDAAMCREHCSGAWVPAVTVSPEDDLVQVVSNASYGAVIELADGVYKLTATVEVTRPLTIVAQHAGKAILDGSGIPKEGNRPIMKWHPRDVTSDTLSLQGVGFIHGINRHDGPPMTTGGCLDLKLGVATIASCSFTDCQATFGDSIHINGAMTKIINSTFTDVGGILIEGWSYDKGGNRTYPHVEIRGSNFTNIAGGYNVIEHVSGELQISESFFEGNAQSSVFAHGGNETSVSVTDSVFRNNKCSSAGTVEIEGPFGDPGPNVFLTRCEFSSNVAKKGGAVSIHDSNLMMKNCRLTGNTATEAGGGLYAGLQWMKSAGGLQLTIDELTHFEGNHAPSGTNVFVSKIPVCSDAYVDMDGKITCGTIYN